jgi:hypothetical protein
MEELVPRFLLHGKTADTIARWAERSIFALSTGTGASLLTSPTQGKEADFLIFPPYPYSRQRSRAQAGPRERGGSGSAGIRRWRLGRAALVEGEEVRWRFSDVYALRAHTTRATN